MAGAIFSEQVKQYWDSIDQEARMLGCFAGFSAVGGTAVTWLLSSATHPLVGGAGTLLTSMVGLAILNYAEVNNVKDNVSRIICILYGMTFANVVTSLAFSVLGLSLSIPLALLYTVLSAASLVGSMALNEK
jgi:hypothetical protein